MAKIKICGLMREQDIDAVNTALPDYIRFVFARSKRQIDEKKAKALKACLNPFIKAVGVFVNEEIKNVIKLCNSHVIDMIQLHGDENEDYIKRLKNCVSNKFSQEICSASFKAFLCASRSVSPCCTMIRTLPPFVT
jgi:phosphoribosylanthranilate isomerase